MLADLKGRVALVTGAGSADGIGFATAHLLAAQGATVGVTSTTERIHDRAAELGSENVGFVCDLRNFENAEKLVARVIERFGKLDILVNNAGMVQTGAKELSARFESLTESQWDSEIELNLKTCFNVTRVALPHMVKKEYGRVVNVSSVTGPVASNPGMSAYSAAKAGVISLTKSLGKELARDGVLVTCVTPATGRWNCTNRSRNGASCRAGSS